MKNSTTNKTVNTLVSTLILSLALVGAHGQETKNAETIQKPIVEITTETTSEETTDWGYDSKDGRSRIGMSNSRLPGKTKVLKSTTSISQVIDVRQSSNELLCESDIDLEYYQKDKETEVRTLFSSHNCDEFDATYQLRIMYVDADGDIQRIIADEEWPVGRTEQVRKSYPMNPNSELRRVTSRILSCTCRDAQ